MSTPPIPAVGPGTVLGRYQVLSHLASGGMAEIFLARATGLEGFERHVVVKCIKPEHARDERFVRMFIDEARLSAQLHHQNIAQVYDIGEVGGTYYFAMEYVHGENARELLHKVALLGKQVPYEHALGIVAAAAAGLHYAHEKRGADRRPLGIVHRDVSPSNILVAYDGAVKVVDFGIAKAAVRMTETRSGTLKGKIAYMSPEQCTGKAIDRRSDVFALGIVLYELTTTSRLFKGESDYVTMNKIVTGELVPPSSRRPDYPRALEAIVMRALATDPGARHPTCAALLDDLIGFGRDQRITTSSLGLERYLRELFGDKPEPWLNLGGDDVAVEDIVLPPSDAVRAATATATRAAEPSGVTAPTPPQQSGPASQGSLLLSAEIESMPESRSRRPVLWLGSAILAGGALIGGAVIFDGRRRDHGSEIGSSRSPTPIVAPDAAEVATGRGDTAPAPQPVDAAVEARPSATLDAGEAATQGTTVAAPSAPAHRGVVRRTVPRKGASPAGDSATPDAAGSAATHKTHDARDLHPPD